MLLLFSATIFLSAFLLFQVQPMIGRFILPWFGSAPGVWTTCMLFFQALLLLGYSYAHFAVSRCSPRRQALVHGGLLVLVVLTLPITPDAAWKPPDGEMPVTRILTILLLSVGAPYLLLSSTGPLLQGWFARLSTASPYRLYALSNLGSLLALLSYPVWVEPNFALSRQTVGWSAGFVLFAALCGGCAWRLARSPGVIPAGKVEGAEGRPPGFADIGLWLALATCGSALLLATTNQLCLDVAVVPFLWVLPLAVYLLSFVFCFDHDRWYVRPLFFALLPVVMINAVRLMEGGIKLGIRDQVLGYTAVLFVGCMCCHGEMARRRPAPRYLTLFFLVLAIGGALGGLLVAIVAPAVFSGFYEFPITLLATCGTVALAVLHDRFLRPSLPERPWRRLLRGGAWGACALAILAGAVLVLLPGGWLAATASAATEEAFAEWTFTVRVASGFITLFALVMTSLAVRRGRTGLPAWSRNRTLAWSAGAALAGLGVACLGGALAWLPVAQEEHHVSRGRNFYGVLAIKKAQFGFFPSLGLMHGRVTHGIQLIGHPDWPASYYGADSGVGIALEKHPARNVPGRPFRVGVVGLGAGVLAAYANADIDMTRTARYVSFSRHVPSDTMRFYEINPMVLNWAEEKFTFLPDARRRGAVIETVLGDARLALERELAAGHPQRFDVLVIDAFAGDAIPIHLLTRESLEVYLSHLAEGGILAVHVSNRYLDVKPVVYRLFRELGLELLDLRSAGVDRFATQSASWMLLTTNRDFIARSRMHHYARTPQPEGPLWTDDYSAVYPLVRFRN